MKTGKLVIALLIAAPVTYAGSGNIHWGYEGHEGPAHWGDLSPAFSTCKSGVKQSPINIADAKKAKSAPIEFHYKASSLNVVNNGHTIQANYDKGSYAVIGGKRYDLLQFHFHGPSENTIDGKAYPMEAHLVHKAADGQLAVVGIMMKQGKTDGTIGKVWKVMPVEAGKASGKAKINAADLLPRDRSYYHFSGSLTTPPCSEGVNWNVMANAVEVSADQVGAFQKMFRNNARPVQPLHGREVALQ